MYIFSRKNDHPGGNSKVGEGGGIFKKKKNGGGGKVSPRGGNFRKAQHT